MGHFMRKPVFGIFDQARHTLGYTVQKMHRGFKFLIGEVEELYHLCSENKGSDQLSGFCAADLRLCFRICKKQVFS